MIFSFYDLPACNKKTDILPLTIAVIAHLRSQFNHVFALLIPMPRFKSIICCKNRPKIKLFLQKKKKLQNLQALGPLLPDSLVSDG